MRGPLPGVGGPHSGQPQQIVHAGAVQLRQLYQRLWGHGDDPRLSYFKFVQYIYNFISV